jgi:HSP20 family protein
MPKRGPDEIEQLFADLWQVFPFAGLRRGFRPQVDIYRTDEPRAVHVVVELPGVDPDAVHVVASGTRLVIAGERARPRCEGQTYQQMEIDYGTFERHVVLPEPVDTSAAEATYDRGLLTVVLPLAVRPAREERVPIEVRRG